jgi:DNA-binding MarR family transcriptional regulator
MRARVSKAAAKASGADTATGSGPAKPDMGRLESAPGFLIGRAWRDAQRQFDRHFGALKITAPQYAILILLQANEGCTPGQLAIALGMGHNNLVVVIDDLVDRGLIERTTCVDDRRKRRLSLTKAGFDMLRRGDEAEDRNAAEFAARLGPADAARLLALLRRF